MKSRYCSLFAACLLVAACSPSIKEIETILNNYIEELGEEGPTSVLDLEKTDKNIYSGTYSVAQGDILYTYPFTAIVKGNQVSNFFKDSDDNNVMVITIKPEVLASHDGGDFTEDDFVYETKREYEERIRREEKERQAASRRASGDGLGQKGANYLLSGHNNIIQIISYKKASEASTALYQMMYGTDAIVYQYKVLEADGYGGTQTAAYNLVFKNGNIVYKETSVNSDFLDALTNPFSL